MRSWLLIELVHLCPLPFFLGPFSDLSSPAASFSPFIVPVVAPLVLQEMITTTSFLSAIIKCHCIT